MRVLLAGASGVIGRLLTPLLVAEGHDVIAMTRSESKLPGLRALGSEPALCDVFDLAQLISLVETTGPDAVMHQMTDLPDEANRLPEFNAANNRMRREGTRNLLEAAGHAPVSVIVAQSVAWKLPGEGGAATADLERQVLEANGVVLRYGQFYGPGTYHEDGLPEGPRIEVADAARRSISALSARPGIYVLTDP